MSRLSRIHAALARAVLTVVAVIPLAASGQAPGLTREVANEIVEQAIARARAQGYRPLTVVVLDASGHLKAMQREDGASMFRFDVATGKAWAAVGMGSSSSLLAERARQNPNFFITLAATADGRFLPQPGGVLILDDDGNILGAAGASGAAGTEDEEAVAFGIRAAGLRTDIDP